MKWIWPLTVAVAVALGLVVAACGDDDSTTNGTPAQTQAPGETNAPGGVTLTVAVADLAVSSVALMVMR